MKKQVQSGNIGGKLRSDCAIVMKKCRKTEAEIVIHSKVKALYGKRIHSLIQEMLCFYHVDNVCIEIFDSGALDYVIAARLEACIQSMFGDKRHFPVPLKSENCYDTPADQSRYSRLYLPGNTPSMFINAGLHKPYGIILDLEDSVAPEKKEEARFLVRNALCSVNFFGAERMVRINQLPGGLDDLDYVVPYNVNVIVVPKCESASQLQEVNHRIGQLRKQHVNDAEHRIAENVWLMPVIESSKGLVNISAIAAAANNVVAMAIGLEDFAADIGVQRTAEGKESFYARTQVVTTCRAVGIQPVDSVYGFVDDMEGLRRNVLESRQLGFDGMGCIHPRQIEVINSGFAPDNDEIARAHIIVAAYEAALQRGDGVVAVNGRMVDLPVVIRARRIIDQVKRNNSVLHDRKGVAYEKV